MMTMVVIKIIMVMVAMVVMVLMMTLTYSILICGGQTHKKSKFSDHARLTCSEISATVALELVEELHAPGCLMRIYLQGFCVHPGFIRF